LKRKFEMEIKFLVVYWEIRQPRNCSQGSNNFIKIAVTNWAIHCFKLESNYEIKILNDTIKNPCRQHYDRKVY
jgi:hypothetical protein